MYKIKNKRLSDMESQNAEPMLTINNTKIVFSDVSFFPFVTACKHITPQIPQGTALTWGPASTTSRGHLNHTSFASHMPVYTQNSTPPLTLTVTTPSYWHMQCKKCYIIEKTYIKLPARKDTLSLSRNINDKKGLQLKMNCPSIASQLCKNVL